MRARAVASIAAVALAAAACGTGSEVAAGDGGLGSDIGVHGSWTIDVHDADGTLAQSASFSNDLTPTGEGTLGVLLSRGSVGGWAVQLLGGPDSHPCSDGATTVPCTIAEPGYHGGSGFPVAETARSTLTAEPGALDRAIVLTGSAVAANETSISNVQTRLEICPSSVTPADCGGSAEGGTNGPFTGINVAPLDWDNDGNANDGWIPVTAGQTIQITVEISFGTLP